jgi:cell fate regulator YaaT (PSP1 superfamily)
MACGSCASGACGVNKTPAGCRSNGTCGTKGCNKMNSFDWLSNMSLPSEVKFDVVEVKFKGGRKDFFRNSAHLDLYTGDAVVVEMTSGYHIGYVSLQGELVRLQMNKKEVNNDDKLKKIYRKANEKDLEKYEDIRKKEEATLYRTREIVMDFALKMKLSDVEYQADNTKATFYYSADDRVDFRELIKTLAAEFKVRVEMRQITLREEAGRLGGIGSCGRELCCSTWLTDFKTVVNSAARYQNLSLNQAKLSGQCGRLKCCLNYELETYLDALIDIPKVEKPLLTSKGNAVLQKVDIFRKIMWFSYESEANWIPLTSKQVTEIIEMNNKGIVVDALLTQEEKEREIRKIEIKANPSSLNADLDRMDKKFSKEDNLKKKKKKKRPTNPNTPAQAGANINETPNPQKPINTAAQPQQRNNQQGQQPAKGNQAGQGNQSTKGNQTPKERQKENQSQYPKRQNSVNKNEKPITNTPQTNVVQTNTPPKEGEQPIKKENRPPQPPKNQQNRNNNPQNNQPRNQNKQSQPRKDNKPPVKPE